MNPDCSPLTLTIPSECRMISVARAFVEAACQVANLDKSNTHAVVLAVGEAFTNILRHAYHNRTDARLQIQCWIRPNSIEVCLHDQGEPFDVSTVPHFNPGEMRIGGRGVYLMRKLMDELKSYARPEGGNTLRMVKYCHPQMAVRDCG